MACLANIRKSKIVRSGDLGGPLKWQLFPIYWRFMLLFLCLRTAHIVDLPNESQFINFLLQIKESIQLHKFDLV